MYFFLKLGNIQIGAIYIAHDKLLKQLSRWSGPPQRLFLMGLPWLRAENRKKHTPSGPRGPNTAVSGEVNTELDSGNPAGRDTRATQTRARCSG